MNEGFSLLNDEDKGMWYSNLKTSLFKLAETYTALLANQIIQSVGGKRRFMSYTANGLVVFIDFANDIYEIRVEPESYARPAGGIPGKDGIRLLQEIEIAGFLDNVRGNGLSLSADYVPNQDKAIPTTNRYQISVQHWTSSPFKSYFEQQVLA